jgi:transposase-like protein
MPRLSKMAGTMTEEQFTTAVRRFSRLSQKAQDVARAILVDGHTFEEASSRYGVSRQHVHQWVSKVFAAFEPPGWVTRTVTLPVDKMKLVEQMENDAIEGWMANLPPVRATRSN